MAGYKGQASDKATAIPRKYSDDYLSTMDQRTSTVRALKSRYKQLKSDLGNDVSYQQNSLMKRVIHLEGVIETTEQALMNGEQINFNQYLNSINSLTGLLKTLGLHRRKPPVKSLNEILQGNANETND